MAINNLKLTWCKQYKQIYKKDSHIPTDYHRRMDSQNLSTFLPTFWCYKMSI